MVDRGKYSLSVIEGSDEKITEIEVKRIDGDEIAKEEVSDLLSEFESRFPEDLYDIGHAKFEEDTILHVLVAWQKKKDFVELRETLGKELLFQKQKLKND